MEKSAQGPIFIQRKINVGPEPANIECPSCGTSITTRIVPEASLKTHLLAIFLMIPFCCCCIPYCVKSCQNANHYCPNCSAYVGTYN